MSADDELDPDAQRLVEMARHARSPTEEQRERAYQALMATVGGGAAVGAAKAAAAKSVAKSSLVWLKWAIPAAVIGAAGVGSYLLRQAPSPMAPAPVLVAPAPSSVAPRVVEPGPVAPEPSVVESSAPVASAPVNKPPSAKAATSDDLMQDIDLLHEALAASRSGNAAKALQLARQHQSRYPNSRLRIEREAIEVRSLCSLGRTTEARKIAERMRARAPGSPVSAALAETCAGK